MRHALTARPVAARTSAGRFQDPSRWTKYADRPSSRCAGTGIGYIGSRPASSSARSPSWDMRGALPEWRKSDPTWTLATSTDHQGRFTTATDVHVRPNPVHDVPTRWTPSADRRISGLFRVEYERHTFVQHYAPTMTITETVPWPDYSWCAPDGTRQGDRRVARRCDRCDSSANLRARERAKICPMAANLSHHSCRTASSTGMWWNLAEIARLWHALGRPK